MRYRIGVVEYLLGRPLVTHLDASGADVELVYDVPSRVGERLLSGTLDAGLMPVVQLLEAEGLFALRGPCVACDGPVESVRLYHRKPLERVERLALDAGSRTSALLAQVILRDRYGATPVCIPAEPELQSMLAECDAALLIGDPALRADVSSPHVDLGEEWKALTGLPCVFALWALRQPDRALVELLRAAWRSGVDAVEEVATQEAPQHGLDPEHMRHYLSESIRYNLGSRELDGLREFARRAETHGLLKLNGRWLEFVG
jgi:chorismate dehydratase